MKEKREKEKRKLKLINAEISLLEKEKEMNSNAMIEIENKKEIKKRVRIKKNTEENSYMKIKGKITPGLVNSLNQLIFEISNLPLEYILNNSNKMVLTSEWELSIIEKGYLKEYNKIKELFNSKLLLEEKNTHQFSAIELRRREILKGVKEQKENIKVISKILGEQVKKSSVIERIEKEYSPEEKTNNSPKLSDKYKSILCLFSLMKSNKSNVRYMVPQSKKSTILHSSHSTCLDKIKTEPNKTPGIPELVKYRHYRRNIREGEKAREINKETQKEQPAENVKSTKD